MVHQLTCLLLTTSMQELGSENVAREEKSQEESFEEKIVTRVKSEILRSSPNGSKLKKRWFPEVSKEQDSKAEQ